MANASFDNCTVTKNHGGYGTVFLKLDHSSANISKCKLSSCRFGHFENSNISIENTTFEKGWTIKIILSSLAVIKTSTFIENRSFGANGGAIFLGEKSEMISENCTFHGNSATIEGGAILVTESSTCQDSLSLFFNNTAPNYGNFLFCFKTQNIEDFIKIKTLQRI